MFLLLYYLLRPNWSLSLYVYVFITNCAPVNILRETYTFFTIKRLSIYEIGISCEFRLASHTRSNLLLLSSLPLAFQRPTILHTDSVYIIKSKITNACLSWYLLLIRSPRPSSYFVLPLLTYYRFYQSAFRTLIRTVAPLKQSYHISYPGHNGPGRTWRPLGSNNQIKTS